MNTATTKATLLQRFEGSQHIPAIPAVLAPLLRHLQQPLEPIDAQEVAQMIGQDKSLAAQCLQMANSPLFGRWQKVDSLSAAVLGLGWQRISDIAMSCGLLNIMPRDCDLDLVAFWEHSLGCALVARHFAREISYPDPAKAYLAGLLHDLGIIVNLWVLPGEFLAAFELARAEGIPLHEAEQRVLGFTHCDSGLWLADRWELAPDLKAVVARHHSPQLSREHTALVTLVELSDLLCRMSGLNYGYVENRQVNLLEQTGFAVLSQQCPGMNHLDWARLTFELDSYLDQVHALVRAICQS